MAGEMKEPMSTVGNTVGQIEKKTQQRVVRLFREQLGYDYLGDWTERDGNRNIEEDLLRAFLREKQGYEEALITRALHLLGKAAGDTSRSPYDRNRAVYDLLRYVCGVTHLVGLLPKWVWSAAQPDDEPFSSSRGSSRSLSGTRFKELRTGDARTLRLTARDSAGTASPLAVPLAFVRGHRVPHSVTP